MKNLVISSERINNPGLVATLKRLTEVFSDIGQDFCVIGATARDFLFIQKDENPPRRTKDLDIAVAISSWEPFEIITNALVFNGFLKDTYQKQRFLHEGFVIDVIPYGDIAKNDGWLYWPPDENPAMNVTGFEEALSNSLTVSVDNIFTVKVASLAGLFLLKFSAWLDRGIRTDKDALDMSAVMERYFSFNMEENPHDEVFDWSDFDIYVAGSYWLALDLRDILNSEQLEYYSNHIENELKKEESSLLINKILEGNHQLKYEQVRRAWKQFLTVFRATKR